MTHPFDRKLLELVGFAVWRTRAALGLRHWEMICRIDAVSAGLAAVLLLSGRPWILLALAPMLWSCRPAARKREFDAEERDADLCRGIMPNSRQFLAAACWIRYIASLFYLGASIYAAFQMSRDTTAALLMTAMLALFAQALAEAADIYPTDSGRRAFSPRWEPQSQPVG